MVYRAALLCLCGVLVACGSQDPSDGGEQSPGSTGEDGSTSTGNDASTSSGDGSATADSSSGGMSDPDGSSSSGEPPSAPAPTERWRTLAGPGHATALCLFDDDRIAVATSTATSIEAGTATISVFDREGEQVWSAGFGEPGLTSYFHDLACASDGSVIAVGLQAGEGKWNLPRALMARFDASGELAWSDVAPESPSSALGGVQVDDTGYYVVGMRLPDAFVARYDLDGVEQWRRVDGYGGHTGSFHDLLVQEGVLYAVGETGNDGWLVAMSEDGQVLGSETFDAGGMTSADILVPDPAGGFVVAGYTEPSGFDDPDHAWAVPCDAAGCASEPFDAGEVDALHGFAIDANGDWIVSGPNGLRGRPAGEPEAWTFDTEFDWFYKGDRRKLLAVDGTGALVVAGGDPAELLQLLPSER